MEEGERPRKLQKLDHNTALPLEIGVIPAGQSTPSANSDGHIKEIRKEDAAENDGIGATNSKTVAVAGSGASGPSLSKNQLKKLRRRERWEAGRGWRKEKRKEKLIAKKERQRAARTQVGLNAPAGEDECPSTNNPAPEPKQTQRVRPTLLPITFIIDCDFDDLMTERERASLGSQLTRSYSDNSKAPYRAHLVVSSFNKLLKERFDTVLLKQYESWKGVTFMQEDYVAAAELAKIRMRAPNGGKMLGIFAGKSVPDQGEIVYLSSDSPDTLTELKPYSTYIIGGLVDKNRHKGVCYKHAMDKGTKTAKLPIGDYMEMESRFVLATNHVVDIMIKWLELGDWGKALTLVMPKRKGAVLRERVTGDDGDGDDSGAEYSLETNGNV